MQWGNRSMQHVVGAVEVLGLFDSRDIGGFLDHAHQTKVASGAAAIDAGIDVRNVVADRAQVKAFFYVANGCCKGFSIIITGAKDVERQSLGALAAATKGGEISLPAPQGGSPNATRSTSTRATSGIAT